MICDTHFCSGVCARAQAAAPICRGDCTRWRRRLGHLRTHGARHLHICRFRTVSTSCSRGCRCFSLRRRGRRRCCFNRFGCGSRGSCGGDRRRWAANRRQTHSPNNAWRRHCCGGSDSGIGKSRRTALMQSRRCKAGASATIDNLSGYIGSGGPRAVEAAGAMLRPRPRRVSRRANQRHKLLEMA